MPSTISAGTTAGTAIAIAGDTTGNLAFQTNGTTTAMTIDTSQNVGIGTASPSSTAKLTLTDAGGSGAVARVQFNSATSGVTNGTRVGFTAAGFQPDFEIWNGDAGIVRVATNNTERMRVTPAGAILFNQTGTTNGIGASIQTNLATGPVGVSGSFATVWTIPPGTMGIFTATLGGQGQYGGGALFFVSYGQFPAGGNAFVVRIAGNGGDQSGYSWSWQLASNGQFQMRNDTNTVNFTPSISLLTLA